MHTIQIIKNGEWIDWQSFEDAAEAEAEAQAMSGMRYVRVVEQKEL